MDLFDEDFSDDGWEEDSTEAFINEFRRKNESCFDENSIIEGTGIDHSFTEADDTFRDDLLDGLLSSSTAFQDETMNTVSSASDSGLERSREMLCDRNALTLDSLVPKSDICASSCMAAKEVTTSSGGIRKGTTDSLDSQEPDAFGRYLEKRRTAWKNPRNCYGLNYNVMSGSIVDTKKEFQKAFVSASEVDYCETLYGDSKKAELVQEEHSPVSSFEYGHQYEVLDEVWSMQTSAENLASLTTLDIQSTVAAAFNSRCHLVWLVGVEENGMVTGCDLPLKERDIFRHAFDFALTTEFVPKLDASLVGLRFIKVTGRGEDACVIEITTKQIVSSVYQLSSGRIYHNQDGVVVQMKNVDQGHRSLIEQKVSDELGNNLECLTPNGKIEYPPLLSSSKSFLRVCDVLVGLATGILISVYIRKLI